MGGVLIGVEGKHDIYQRQTTKTVSNIKLSIAYEIKHDIYPPPQNDRPRSLNIKKIKKISSTTKLFSDHEIEQIPCLPEDISTPDPPTKIKRGSLIKNCMDDVIDAGSENASSDPHSSDRSGNLQTRVKRHFNVSRL